MTRGTIVLLGPVSYNVGAGMTGGAVYLRREHAGMINTGYIVPRDMDDEDEKELRELIESYARATGSRRAQAVLDNWAATGDQYFKCSPRRAD